MSLTRAYSWFCVLSLVLAARVAVLQAQPAPKDPGASAAAPARASAAFALLDEALTLADADRWLDAKAKLEQAKELYAFPNVLFHLGRAHYALQEWSQARATLEQFQAVATAYNPNLDAAERMLQDIDVQAAQETRSAPAAAAEPPRRAASVEDSTFKVPLLSVVTLGVGGATLIAAAVTGLLTNGQKGVLDRNCDAAGVCTPQLHDVRDSGDGLKHATNVLLVLGAAAVTVGGGYWLFKLMQRQDAPPERAVQAHAACSLQGCLGTLSGSF